MDSLLLSPECRLQTLVKAFSAELKSNRTPARYACHAKLAATGTESAPRMAAKPLRVVNMGLVNSKSDPY